MKKIIVAYIPVLHKGYRDFFEAFSDAEELYIFGDEMIAGYEHLRKDIRRLLPEQVKEAVESWKMFKRVGILDEKIAKRLADEKVHLIIPDDDLADALVDKYFKSSNPIHRSLKHFLRWDKKKSVEQKMVREDRSVSLADFDREVMRLLYKESNRSSDWWRQVGAAVIRDNKVILKTYNQHVPDHMAPYVYGDPRADFHKGDHIELSTAIHAEANLIAEAAKKGISLEGASMYVTTFPCPPCAKLIAYSGIKELYYAEGYSVLDGESILKSRGVKITLVYTDPLLDRS